MVYIDKMLLVYKQIHKNIRFVINVHVELYLCLCFRVGPVIICIVGLKLLRSAFSDSSRQHLILVFTLLFFSFDFAYVSETLLVDYFFMSIFMAKVKHCTNFNFVVDENDDNDDNDCYHDHPK